jgi:hypothetical protein
MGCNKDIDCDPGQRCHATVLNSGKQFTFCVDPKYHVKVASFMEEKAQNILANKIPEEKIEKVEKIEKIEKVEDKPKVDVISSDAEAQGVKPVVAKLIDVEAKPVVQQPIVAPPVDSVAPVDLQREPERQPVFVRHEHVRTASYDEDALNDDDMNGLENALDDDEDDEIDENALDEEDDDEDDLDNDDDLDE